MRFFGITFALLMALGTTAFGLSLSLPEKNLQSIVSRLDPLSLNPLVTLKSWEFLREIAPSKGQKNLAREYVLEMTGALPHYEKGWQSRYPQIASRGFTLTLFQAPSTQGKPDHVESLALNYQADLERADFGNVPDLFLPTLQTLSRTCFGLGDADWQALSQDVQSAKKEAAQNGKKIVLSSKPLVPVFWKITSSSDHAEMLEVHVGSSDFDIKNYCSLAPTSEKRP